MTAGFWFGEREPKGMDGKKAKINELVLFHLHGRCSLSLAPSLTISSC